MFWVVLQTVNKVFDWQLALTDVVNGSENGEPVGENKIQHQIILRIEQLHVGKPDWQGY